MVLTLERPLWYLPSHSNGVFFGAASGCHLARMGASGEGAVVFATPPELACAPKGSVFEAKDALGLEARKK